MVHHYNHGDVIRGWSLWPSCYCQAGGHVSLPLRRCGRMQEEAEEDVEGRRGVRRWLELRHIKNGKVRSIIGGRVESGDNYGRRLRFWWTCAMLLWLVVMTDDSPFTPHPPQPRVSLPSPLISLIGFKLVDTSIKNIHLLVIFWSSVHTWKWLKI